MGSILRNKLKSLLVITISVLLLAYAISSLVRFVATPIVNSYINEKAQQYGIKFAKQSLELNGAIRLTDVHTKLKNGATVTIADLIIRPPLSILPGYIKAKELNIIDNKVKVHLDSLNANNIAHNHNNIDNSLATKLGSAAKILYKYNIGNLRLNGGRLYLSSEEKSKPLNFTLLNLYSLKNGLIEKLKLYNLEAIINYNNTEILASTNYLEGSQLNLDYFLQLYQKQVLPGASTKSLWQNLKLHTTTIANLDPTQTARMQLQDFYSGPLYLKPLPENFKTLLTKVSREKNKHDALQALELMATSLTQASVSIKDLAITLPNIAISLKQAAIQSTQWENLIPEKLSASFDNLLLAPKTPAPKSTVPMNFAGKLNFVYNNKNGIAKIKALDFSAKDLCNFHSIMEISNVNSALFTAKADLEQINDIKFNNMYISYINKGLIPALINSLSQAAQLPPTEIKELVDSFIEKSPPLFIDNKELALQVSQFLTNLAKQPQKVELWLRAKNPTKLRLDDLINNLRKNPSYLINNLNIQVKNQIL